MNAQEKYEEYRSSTEDAIKKIERYRTCETYTGLALFTDFILTTPFNPYRFLPRPWVYVKDTATGLAQFLDVMHHALYDDGEICFPVYKGEPRIAFLSMFEDPKRYLTDAELNALTLFSKTKSNPIEITFLEGIEEFIKVKTEVERNLLKKQYLFDKETLLLSVESYKTNPLFDPSWDLIEVPNEEDDKHYNTTQEFDMSAKNLEPYVDARG